MSIYDCKECGTPRINTPSGSACPNGCGKIHPTIPRKAMRIIEASSRGIPLAKSERGTHFIDGHEGEFTPGAIFRKKISEAFKCEGVIAIDGDNLREFTKKETK